MRLTARTPGAAAVAVAIVLTAGPAVAAAPAPLEQARSAAEQTSFEGVLEVKWLDGGVTRSERLTVQAAGGALLVVGTNRVMARPQLGPLFAPAGGGWEEMWLPSLVTGARPAGMPKYATTPPADGPLVAGRRTHVVEVDHDGRLLERLYLDTETDLLLERDQYDPQGRVVRTLAFDSLTLDPGASPPAAPADAVHRAPAQVAPDRLASPAAAPGALVDGYERIGIYRSGSVLHVLYSDGLYDLSVFEQPGRLRHSDLPPAGERVAVGHAAGWHYPWPGGQVVVWSAGGRVFTAVSDAPVEQVLAAVRSLPPIPTRELSLLGKIRRACQAVMEPLS